MLKAIHLVFCVVLLMAVCQCHRFRQTTRHPVLGAYDLTAHDNSGLLVFTGTIMLESIEQNHLKGRCNIVREQNAPVYVVSQNAACEALLEGRKISFDLAPMMADGGMLFEGELSDGRFTGIWMLDGFVGSGTLGRIEAVKQSETARVL